MIKVEFCNLNILYSVYLKGILLYWMQRLLVFTGIHFEFVSIMQLEQNDNDDLRAIILANLSILIIVVLFILYVI